jgi:hypothetical protein
MYYLFIDDKQAGPYTISQLRSMWASGKLTADTLYFTEGMSEWSPLAAIVETIEEREEQIILGIRRPCSRKPKAQRSRR